MRIVSIALGAVGAFFLFYTVRLLVVTQVLRHTRPGGQGAYIGAVAFPLIALVSLRGSVALWRRATLKRDRPA